MKPFRIAYIDNDPIVHILGKLVFERLAGEEGMEIEVTAYADPLTLLDTSDPDHYDLIITDLNMPLMNGLDFCRIVKQRGVNTPIVLATSAAGPLQLQNAPIHYEYLHPVPITVDVARSIIRDVLKNNGIEK